MPTTPVHVEQRFQDLLLFLSYPASARQRLNAVVSFLRSHRNSTAFEPYAIELAQRLPAIIEAFEPFGVPPEELRGITTDLSELVKQYPIVSTISHLEISLRYLRTATAGQFLIVGLIQEAATFLGNSENHALPEPSARDHSSPSLLLHDLIQNARASFHPLAKELDQIRNTWNSWLDGNSNALFVPVVERLVADSSTAPHIGRLRHVAVKIHGKADSTSDQIHADVAIFGDEQTARMFETIPVSAARKLLAQTHPSLSYRGLSGTISFSGTQALHQGTSAHLAIAALTSCAILRFTEQREQYSILPTVPMTGGLDASGNVLAVDSEALKSKVEAVFFSPAEYLVVPREQVAIAERESARLSKEYPSRILHVLGVAHVREIFYDRRLSNLRRLSLPHHIARLGWQKKGTVGGVTTILLLLALVARLAYGPIDKNPVSGEFKEELLLVKNKYGDVLEEIAVGSSTVSYATDFERVLAAFHDFDGDKENEIIWVEQPSKENAYIVSVRAKKARADTLLWSASLNRKLNYRGKPDVTSEHFPVSQILVGDFDNDGRPEVFVNAQHEFFPGIVVKLDAITGQELGMYLHQGHLSNMKSVDLDGDGIQEIVLCGINNALRKAAVVVLDPRFVQGQSPATRAYEAEGFGPGRERAYILIPKTIVAQAFEFESKYNFARSFAVVRDSKVLRIDLHDLAFPVSYAGSTVKAHYYAHLGFDLSLKGVGTGDDYDMLAERLFADGKIKRLPDVQYFEEFKKELQYWDGDRWHNRPVVNRRWEGAVKG